MLSSRWTSFAIVVFVGCVLWALGMIGAKEVFDAALWSSIALLSHAWACKINAAKTPAKA